MEQLNVKQRRKITRFSNWQLLHNFNKFSKSEIVQLLRRILDFPEI